MLIDRIKTGINTTRSNLMSFNHSSASPPVTIESRRSQPKPTRHERHAGRFAVFGLAILVVATGLLIIGLLPRFHDEVERRQTADAIRSGANKVQVVRPKEAPPEFEFSLPGAAEALTQATLYARINGYLKQRLVDIGDHVEAGQLLAVIDAPDIDTQLNQAIAQFARSRAALTIARLNYDREKNLLQTRVVSQQEYDQNQDIFNEATANVKANEANVQNLMARVATLMADHRIAFKTIIIGRDFGTTVEITAGLTSDDLLVDNPPLELVEGAKVEPEGMEGNSQPSHKRASLETKKVVGIRVARGEA